MGGGGGGAAVVAVGAAVVAGGADVAVDEDDVAPALVASLVLDGATVVVTAAAAVSAEVDEAPAPRPQDARRETAASTTATNRMVRRGYRSAALSGPRLLPGCMPIRAAADPARYGPGVRRRLPRGGDGPSDRLAAIERRLEDLEDLVAAALSVERLDDLERRVDELALMAPTIDDLLQLRMQLARLHGDIVAAEEQQYRRRAG